LDLKPSQCSGITGMPNSASQARAMLSTSSPIMALAQEVAMKIALG
jgi:hypothetical protein